MAEKSRRKKKGEEEKPPAVDLTSFLSPQSEERAAPRVQAFFTEDVERMIVEEVTRSSGGVTRSELYKRVTGRGVKPVEFYRALTNLLGKGVLKRRFSPELEEYVIYKA
ncbi:hypothetical protein [Thermofilum pendens]|uniref:Uncharacterized protein n=1 Tax=Thermofilum pendens (strain DSM 2475 / Hrk 5) TaxID=368408 RepID=A1RX79_THEPD|nr:hypothetical protein [Thermofilum pendens]ABL77809.1 hypothetical protein Tpen_0400 [Thermofilum pendens Hrk 5]